MFTSFRAFLTGAFPHLNCPEPDVLSEAELQAQTVPKRPVEGANYRDSSWYNGLMLSAIIGLLVWGAFNWKW